MKTLLALVLSVSLLFAGGCAKQQAKYQDTIVQINELAIVSVQEQAQANSDRRTQGMRFFSQAMTEASKTEDPTDNVVIAFAWGFQSGTPDKIEMPKLQFPAKPSDGVDYMRAGVPYFNIIWPWLWGAYGNNSNNSGQRITATDNATVMLESGNAGSFNTATDQATIDAGGGSVINQHDDFVFEAGGDINGSAGGTGGLGAEGDPVNPIEPDGNGDFVLAECLANPPAGYSDSGTPLYSTGLSCRTYAEAL